MSEIAVHSNKALPYVAQQADVPSSEPIFVLSSSQLQDIIKEATKSLNLRIYALEGRITQLERDKAKIEALEKDQNILADNQLIQLRLINDLRKDREPQPLQKDRGEILRALITANGGKMLAKEARQKMRLADYTFSKLIATMKDTIEIKPFHLRENQNLLVLK